MNTDHCDFKYLFRVASLVKFIFFIGGLPDNKVINKPPIDEDYGMGKIGGALLMRETWRKVEKDGTILLILGQFFSHGHKILDVFFFW